MMMLSFLKQIQGKKSDKNLSVVKNLMRLYAH